MSATLKRKGRKIISESSKEPTTLDINAEERQAKVVHIFNWYDQQDYKTETNRKWINSYVKRNKLDITLRGVPDSMIPKRPISYLCRMDENGIELTDKEREFILSNLKDLSAKYEGKHQPKKNYISVADRVKAIAREKYFGEVDYYIDCLISGKKPNDIVKWVADQKLEVAYVRSIVNHLESYLIDFTEAIDSKDKYVKESWGFLTKRKWEKIIEQIMKTVGDFDEVKKEANKARKPRKKKVIPPAKQVEKLRFKEEFEGVKSIDPKKIIGAGTLVAYDTETRKLIILKSDGGFTVKGTVVHNINEDDSFKVTLRQKNLGLVKELAECKIRKLNNALKTIKTKKAKTTGRINEKIIILSVI